jgi:hypothetical protein
MPGPARWRDDTEEAGGKRVRGTRGRAAAGDVLLGVVDLRRRFESVRMGAKEVHIGAEGQPGA